MTRKLARVFRVRHNSFLRIGGSLTYHHQRAELKLAHESQQQADSNNKRYKSNNFHKTSFLAFSANVADADLFLTVTSTLSRLLTS